MTNRLVVIGRYYISTSLNSSSNRFVSPARQINTGRVQSTSRFIQRWIYIENTRADVTGRTRFPRFKCVLNAFSISKSPGVAATSGFDAPFTRPSEENEPHLVKSAEEISPITSRGRAARAFRGDVPRSALRAALRVCVRAHLCAHVRTVERQDLDISCNKLWELSPRDRPGFILPVSACPFLPRTPRYPSRRRPVGQKCTRRW